MSKVPPGSLKCVIVRGGGEVVLSTLTDRLSADSVRKEGPGAIVVHTAMSPAELRDWLARELPDGESLLVLEFEKWSSYGGAVDREWLLARGH